jgi:hypothetical protein
VRRGRKGRGAEYVDFRLGEERYFGDGCLEVQNEYVVGRAPLSFDNHNYIIISSTGSGNRKRSRWFDLTSADEIYTGCRKVRKICRVHRVTPNTPPLHRPVSIFIPQRQFFYFVPLHNCNSGWVHQVIYI